MSIELARRYLAAISAGTTGDALAAFFHPAVVFHELPNRLVPNGAQSDLAAILAGAERGQKIVADQRYLVKHAVEAGDTVALEVDWSATLKIPIGNTPAGGTMSASIGMFITYAGGKIISQRNYDCYPPF